MVKELVIDNENGKLNAPCFSHLHMAPPLYANATGSRLMPFVTRELFDQVFVIHQPEESIYVQLTDFVRIPMQDICSFYTQQSSGVEAPEWKRRFFAKYPQTNDRTEMAIYYYRVIKRVHKNETIHSH